MKRLLFFFLCITTTILCSEESTPKFQIRIVQKDRQMIHELISSLGEKNLGRLLLESRSLAELGKKIEHVPPLQFIGFIVEDPYLKDCLRKVYNSYFKWASFVDGFSGSMEKELHSGQLQLQLAGFAAFMGIHVERLERIVYDQDWEEFIKILI